VCRILASISRALMVEVSLFSDHDTRATVAASHQAPFGKGEETIVDENVGKT
jgi:hypothetical protein